MTLLRLFFIAWLLLISIPVLAQGELPPGISNPPPPPAPPFAPTFTLFVCLSGDEYVFSYETDHDIYAVDSYLMGVNEPLHWGALFVLYADPLRRETFTVPVSAIAYEGRFGPVQWTVLAAPHEQQTVIVDNKLTDCSPSLNEGELASIGQRVYFSDETGRQRSGTITNYLYRSQLDFPIFGMDDVMYIVDYGDVSQRVLNRYEFNLG